MPRVLHVRPFDRQLEGVVVPERLGVVAYDLAPPFLECRELPELPQAKCGLDVRHVVLEAGREDLIAPAAALVVPFPGVPTQAVQTQQTRAFEEAMFPREHASLGGREVLGGVETERNRIRTRTDLASAVGGRNGVGRVL